MDLLKGLQTYEGIKLTWTVSLPTNIQHLIAAKLCIRPPKVFEVQERAWGPLSPCRVWWGLGFTRRWGGQKRWVFCWSVRLKLEYGPMPKVMATQPNIGGYLCKSSVIPLLVPCHMVWLMATAQVLCSNAANMEECKIWTQSAFHSWKNSVMGQEPPKMYIQCTSRL